MRFVIFISNPLHPWFLFQLFHSLDLIQVSQIFLGLWSLIISRRNLDALKLYATYACIKLPRLP